jgi:Uncharacterised protein conserved in bacteria (DUF2336)/PilZ domain
MSERLSILAILEPAIARSPVRRRVEIAMQLSDLFVQLSDQISEALISLFDTLFERIAEEVDTSALADLSRQLARLENAPVNLMRSLASCTDIGVAYPVLAYSSRLDEGSLIRLARAAGQKHLLAISLRKSLSEALTDALIGRQIRSITLSVVKNPKAQIGEATFCLLAEQCVQDEVLARVLAARGDILALLAKVSEGSRASFLAAAPGVRKEIDRALAKLVEQFCQQSTPAGVAPVAVTEAGYIVPDLDEPGALVSITPAAAGQNDFKDVAAPLLEPPPEAERSDEGRRAVRQRTFLRGCLFFNSGRSSVECMIRDLTAKGAKLLISAVVNLPEKVELYIPQKEKKLRAHIVWRTTEEVGISFAGTEASANHSVSVSLNERITHLEEKVGALRAPLMRVTRAVADKLSD